VFHGIFGDKRRLLQQNLSKGRIFALKLRVILGAKVDPYYKGSTIKNNWMIKISIMQGYEMIRNEVYRMGLNLGKNEMIEDPEITTKIYTWWERWI